MNLFDLNDYDDEFYFAKGWPSRSKTHEKNWGGGGKFGLNEPKSGPKLLKKFLMKNFIFCSVK